MSDVWSWEPEHDRAINKVKKLTTQIPVLRHYDPDIDLTVQSDASQDHLHQSSLNTRRA